MMDVALSGPGFFSVRDKNGVIRYTRGGSFTQNAQNQLVTTDGDSVMGTNGQPVSLRQQGNVSVDLQGRVSQNGQLDGNLAVVAIKIDPRGGVTSNGIETGRLGVYEFSDMNELRPIGNDKFVNAGAAPKIASQTVVLQGSQEKSNSNVISSMVDLIANERWFDANEKMIQTQDTELGAAITTVGKSTPA
jgi:flagellar basal-body rod protein FlgG